jgi:hypothetical protein
VCSEESQQQEIDALEILCNQVENEGAKDKEAQEKRKMQVDIDFKLAMIRAEKQKAKEGEILHQA